MAEDRPLTVKERMAMFNKKPDSPAPLIKAPSGRFPKTNTIQNQVQTKAVDPIVSPSNIKQEKKIIEKPAQELRPTSSSMASTTTSPRTTSSEKSFVPGKLSSNKFNNFSSSNVNINAVKLGTPPPPIPPARKSPVSNVAKSPVSSFTKSPVSNNTKTFPPSTFPISEQKSTSVQISSDITTTTSPKNSATINVSPKSNIPSTRTDTKQTNGSSAGISESGGPPRQSVKKLSAGIGANINMNSLLGKSPPPRPTSRAITPPFTPEGSSSSRPVSTPVSPNHSGELQHLSMGRPKSYNRRLSTTPDKSIFLLVAETKLLTMDEDIDMNTSP